MRGLKLGEDRKSLTPSLHTSSHLSPLDFKADRQFLRGGGLGSGGGATMPPRHRLVGWPTVMEVEGWGWGGGGWGLGLEGGATTPHTYTWSWRGQTSILVAVLERRAGARAQILARRRGSEASDVLRSPEPAMQEAGIGSGASLARAKRRARVTAAQATRVDLFLLLIKKPWYSISFLCLLWLQIFMLGVCSATSKNHIEVASSD